MEKIKFNYVESIGDVGTENMNLVEKKLLGLIANEPTQSYQKFNKLFDKVVALRLESREDQDFIIPDEFRTVQRVGESANELFNRIQSSFISINYNFKSLGKEEFKLVNVNDDLNQKKIEKEIKNITKDQNLFYDSFKEQVNRLDDEIILLLLNELKSKNVQ